MHPRRTVYILSVDGRWSSVLTVKRFRGTPGEGADTICVAGSVVHRFGQAKVAHFGSFAIVVEHDVLALQITVPAPHSLSKRRNVIRHTRAGGGAKEGRRDPPLHAFL